MQEFLSYENLRHNSHYQKYIECITWSKSQNRFKDDGEYYENHHILPRSMGGTLDADNLVLLTATEHYQVHEMLTMFTVDIDERNMLRAWYLMSHKNGELISESDYARLRKEYIISTTGENSPRWKGGKEYIDLDNRTWRFSVDNAFEIGIGNAYCEKYGAVNYLNEYGNHILICAGNGYNSKSITTRKGTHGWLREISVDGTICSKPENADEFVNSVRSFAEIYGGTFKINIDHDDGFLICTRIM